MNKHATTFIPWIEGHGFPAPDTEHRFHPKRRWRFDFAFPDRKIALEVEGGVFAKVQGRHSRGAGYRADLEKYNTAAVMGWIVIRVLPEQLHTVQCLEFLSRAFALTD